MRNNAPETGAANFANGVPSVPPRVAVRGLTMSYDGRVIMGDLDFHVNPGEIFVIMGGSGCGKSTLLRHLVGLETPASGSIFFNGHDFTKATETMRNALLRHFGVTWQNGALWTSLTLLENVSLPLREHTRLSPREITDIARYKLAITGLAGFEDYMPAQISGGMVKRASLARALALDPHTLFLDEPGAGLDPLTSRLLDDLLLQIRDSLGTTLVLVTHELSSIFAIADRALFLDTATRTVGGIGPPAELRDHSPNPRLRRFLTRGTP
ncbi:MAG: ATP-binding cassette domain-containing protein [Puniceicoccales bacterium]|jgi:phospholipid/cholesterol/gamma-HCH transport system ATP-binding protein|nr:ATP-binding cassette domain-containing protein [Puniceicoccales bacterium]